jgi:cell shape-determining protein MreC
MIRFKHVFNVLLILSAICAFVIPARVSDAVRGNLTVLFAPVSWPTRAICNAIFGDDEKLRDEGAAEPDKAPRPDNELLAENLQLKTLVANLSGRLVQLEQDEALRQTVGKDVRDLCITSSVVGVGGDTALRQSLLIGAGTMKKVQTNNFVLFGSVGGGGVAGVVSRAHLGGSVVRLVTDRGFKVRVGFARFTTRDGGDHAGQPEFVMLNTKPCLAEGDGDGSMWIRGYVPWEQAKAANLQKGDWVVVRDEDWPGVLQRYRVGQIESIQQWSQGPGFAEIQVKPPADLMQLREVLVLVN